MSKPTVQPRKPAQGQMINGAVRKAKKNVKFIAVEGIIAAGKSTLLRQWEKHTLFRKSMTLAEPIAAWNDVRAYGRLRGQDLADESKSVANSVADSAALTDATEEREEDVSGGDASFNLLKAMYEDGDRWCYTMQTWVLHTYSNTIREALCGGSGARDALDDTEVVFVERSLHANFMFASLMRDLGHLSDMEWVLYQHMFYDALKAVPPLDGVIFVDTSVEDAMLRCKVRHRDGEEGITRDYQKRLLKKHEEVLHRGSLERVPKLVISGKKNFSAKGGHEMREVIRTIDEFIASLDSWEETQDEERRFVIDASAN